MIVCSLEEGYSEVNKVMFLYTQNGFFVLWLIKYSFTFLVV